LIHIIIHDGVTSGARHNPVSEFPQHQQLVGEMAEFPNALTTGVRNGVTLTRVNGTFFTSFDGQIISGIDADEIMVRNDNVTITDCRVGSITTGSVPSNVTTNTTIESAIFMESHRPTPSVWRSTTQSFGSMTSAVVRTVSGSTLTVLIEDNTSTICSAIVATGPAHRRHPGPDLQPGVDRIDLAAIPVTDFGDLFTFRNRYMEQVGVTSSFIRLCPGTRAYCCRTCRLRA
jgi:hypothetical protein